MTLPVGRSNGRAETVFRERFRKGLTVEGPPVGGDELNELFVAIGQLLGRHSVDLAPCLRAGPARDDTR